MPKVITFKNILNSKDDSLTLKDRRDLINAVAERIGKIIKNKQTEEALRESEEKWRSLSENMCPFGKQTIYNTVIHYPYKSNTVLTVCAKSVGL